MRNGILRLCWGFAQRTLSFSRFSRALLTFLLISLLCACSGLSEMRVSSDSNKTPLGQADIAYVQTVVEQVALAHHLKKDPPPVHSPRYLSSYHRGIPDPYVPSPAIWVTLSEDSQSIVIQYQGVTLGQQVKLEILNKLKERFGVHRVTWTNKNSE